ncbi:hypothetical protein ACEUDB_04745 [Aeromonas hydrophila]|uniref:hypothetical protein n=1 Tax=Aeromonas hydrophila TaxID=644 RepID=UPI0038D210DC
MENKNDYSDITEENSFIKLYILCRKMPLSPFSIVTFWITAIIITASYLHSPRKEIKLLLELLHTDSINIVSWSMTITGFVIAGYAIHATLADKKMLMRMHTVQDHRHGMSYLKSINGVYIKICIDLIISTITIFLISNKVLLEVIFPLDKISGSERLYHLLISMFIGIVNALFVLQLVLALSFIYNMHHSVMTAVRWYAMNNTCPNKDLRTLKFRRKNIQDTAEKNRT